MRQIIHDVIRGHSVRQGRIIFGITWVVGPFDGIAHIDVMADPGDDPALVVVDGAELGIKTIELPGNAAFKELRPRDARALVNIVDNVEDLVFAVDIYYGPAGEHLPHALHEDVPFLRAVKIIGHEETAPQKII